MVLLYFKVPYISKCLAFLILCKHEILQWVETNPSNIRIFPTDIRFPPPHGTTLKLLIQMLIQMFTDVRWVGFLPPEILSGKKRSGLILRRDRDDGERVYDTAARPEICQSDSPSSCSTKSGTRNRQPGTLASQGILTDGERLSTIDLLIKVACFVIKVDNNSI
jgi:hypothetical protein